MAIPRTLITILFAALTFGTREAVGLGVTNAVNPLFEPLSSSLAKLAPKPVSPPVPVLPSIVTNTTKTLLDGDGTAGLIGVGPACWGGINLVTGLNIANINLNCLHYGCSDIIIIIWKLFMIFDICDTCDDSLALLKYHLDHVIIISPTETTRVCGLLNRDLHIHSKCVTDYHRTDEVIDVIDKIYSGTYTLKYISNYITAHAVCLKTCLNAHGYPSFPSLPTTKRGVVDAVDLDHCYNDWYHNVCPSCICNIITITALG